MKVLNKLMIGAAALTLLTGCSLLQQKVSYEKFHEKAVAAHDKGHSYVKAVLNGTMEASGMSIKFEKLEYTYASGVWQAKDSSVAAYAGAMIVGTEAISVTDEEGQTYYVGNGFKVTMKDDDGTGTAVFNAAGLMTSMKTTADNGKMNVTVKYSK